MKFNVDCWQQYWQLAPDMGWAPWGKAKLAVLRIAAASLGPSSHLLRPYSGPPFDVTDWGKPASDRVFPNGSGERWPGYISCQEAPCISFSQQHCTNYTEKNEARHKQSNKSKVRLLAIVWLIYITIVSWDVSLPGKNHGTFYFAILGSDV